MSPEQARGEEVDHRTDIWSLGVVLYEMLSGQQPFQGDNLLVISDAIRSNDPAPLPVGESSLSSAVNRALSKDIVGRYQAVTDLLGDLRNTTVSAAQATSQPDVPSIAVLPFANMSSDPDQEYFVDGIAEDLITALSRMRWLSVTARNSTFSYKGQSPDVRKVGRELGVRYVLEGSVRKGGNRVRISAQLVDASDGNHVWAQRYDRELVDIFDVQDEITLTIAGAIEPELAEIERARAHRKPAESLDAWDFCQRALWHMWRFNKDDNAEAQRLFSRAIEIDPSFAAARANLAYSHFMGYIRISQRAQIPYISIFYGLN